MYNLLCGYLVNFYSGLEQRFRIVLTRASRCGWPFELGFLHLVPQAFGLGSPDPFHADLILGI